MKPREVWVIEWENSADKWETWQVHGYGEEEKKEAKRLMLRARRNFKPVLSITLKGVI